MTLMKAKKPLALLLALLAALSLLGTTALAAGLPEETIAAQTELCGEDCGHTHEEVFSHTEHTEESLPEPEEIAVPVATPLLEQPEPEAEQPSDTSGVIPGSGIYWELNEYGWLMLSGNGSCPTFVSPDDQPWAAVREQITQVWFEDMDALSIPSLAYWFTGCTALTMAEIPYTTPVIGAAAFADCPSLRQIQLYYSGAFTIVPGAFSTGALTPLLVLFIPEYDSVLGTLAAYDWTEDRRAAYFEDVYGITLLATGYCSNCKRTCSYTVEYEQWTNSEHCVRHWCSNCGYDQAGGVNGEAHSFRSGVCSKCGYSNGSGGGGGGGGNVCYHSSTRTSWSGCDWYEYCRSCGALVDYGTSHGTYVYGAWEYYSSSQHRRSYACSDCGEGTYRYLSDPVPENMPILEDLYNELRRQEEKEAQYIATALEIYVSGSLNVFNHRTNINIENRIVSFDIKELGKQLKKIGMLIVQDAVWNRVTINREAHKSTRYYIDEMHLLLREEQTAAYTVEIWKRFRKWGGIPTGITQNVKDLLSSREVENIFENSDFILMLNQASGDRQILAKQLNISPHQLSYVTHSGEGEGLLFYGNVILPFVDRFPRGELYDLLTTKPQEQTA